MRSQPNCSFNTLTLAIFVTFLFLPPSLPVVIAVCLSYWKRIAGLVERSANNAEWNYLNSFYISLFCMQTTDVTQSENSLHGDYDFVTRIDPQEQ